MKYTISKLQMLILLFYYLISAWRVLFFVDDDLTFLTLPLSTPLVSEEEEEELLSDYFY
jgi:uncharacterized membrane protein